MVSGKVLAENKWQEVLNLLGNIQEYLSEEEFNQSEFARKVYQANAKMMLGKWEDVMMLLKKGNASGFSFPLHWKFFSACMGMVFAVTKKNRCTTERQMPFEIKELLLFIHNPHRSIFQIAMVG